MPVIHIKTTSEFKAKIGGSAPAVVDFTATWCGPCRAIAPLFEKLSNEFPQVLFLKVDVDELQIVAQEAGVSAMPTFQIYQNGAKIQELIGANPGQLSQLISQVAATAAAPAAPGRKLGGDEPADDQQSAREKAAAAAEARLQAAHAQ